MLYAVEYEGWIGIIEVSNRQDPDRAALRHLRQYFDDVSLYDADVREAEQEDIDHVRGMGGYVPQTVTEEVRALLGEGPEFGTAAWFEAVPLIDPETGETENS